MCGDYKPLDDFRPQAPGTKPAMGRPEVHDWWTLMALVRPTADVAQNDKHKAISKNWGVDRSTVRSAARRGRLYFDDGQGVPSHVVAKPWEQNAFCAGCQPGVRAILSGRTP